MEQFVWRPLKTVTVPQTTGAAWTPAIDYIVAKRLYRLSVKDGGKWKLPDATADCTADGNYALGKPSQPLPCASTPRGALIAKVGGCTADTVGTIFGVGRYCVFQMEDAKAGTLFLGANDLPETATKIEGKLEVDIEVAL